MRSAGVPIEAMIEYVKLFQEGDSTIPARLQLLQEQRENFLEQKAQIDRMLDKLNYKISRYEVAAKTGKLVWDKEEENGKYTPLLTLFYKSNKSCGTAVHL